MALTARGGGLHDKVGVVGVGQQRDHHRLLDDGAVLPTSCGDWGVENFSVENSIRGRVGVTVGAGDVPDDVKVVSGETQSQVT